MNFQFQRPEGFKLFASRLMVLIIVTIIAMSWLAFPYFIQGKQVLREAGSSVKHDKRLQVSNITQFLTQRVTLPINMEVDALYAIPDYFQYSDKAGFVSEYRPDINFVFFVVESTHDFNLPNTLPIVELVVDNKRYSAMSIEGPLDVEHHRTNIALFPKKDSDGNRILTEHTKEVRLEVFHQWSQNMRYSQDPDKLWKLAYVWQNPVEIPPELQTEKAFTPLLIISLSAGLLSAVLTPCLLQLLVIYLVTMTGVTAENLSQFKQLDRQAKSRLIQVALAFTGGFVVLFTVAGAFVGYSGKEAQVLFAEHSRTVSVVAGILVILLGIWMGMRTRAPLVCHIPGKAFLDKLDKKGVWSSALVAIAFSLGCISCFGGAIIATLFIYVGSLGSPATGALVMFLFSAGVTIPFMLAAVFLSKSMPILNGLAKHSAKIGFVSMLFIIGFGIILITDNFHVISDLLYAWLGLS